MSFLRYLCLFWYSAVQRILSCVFTLFFGGEFKCSQRVNSSRLLNIASRSIIASIISLQFFTCTSYFLLMLIVLDF
jgi:hypothetical protein